LPGLIDLYESHAADRDKFVILAFHDQSAKDLAELDKHLPKLRQQFWRGRDLPFPILLDGTGKTIKDYGISGFPTTLLIDPEGKLIGPADGDGLEEKLPPLPVAVRTSRALDRGQSLAFDEFTLEKAVEFFARMSHIDIRLDKSALESAHISGPTRVPLKLTGFVSLRSWLDLVTGALDLTYLPDDKGILLTAKNPEQKRQEESEFQRSCAKRIEGVLDKNISFDFHEQTLADVAGYLESKTNENFVLDPAARRAGRLDPSTKVTGSAKDVPLRQALQKLLTPVGLKFAVRDEVVIIE
jgi:hypothetical protein